MPLLTFNWIRDVEPDNPCHFEVECEIEELRNVAIRTILGEAAFLVPTFEVIAWSTHKFDITTNQVNGSLITMSEARFRAYFVTDIELRPLPLYTRVDELTYRLSDKRPRAKLEYKNVDFLECTSLLSLVRLE